MEYREYRLGDEQQLNDLYNEVFSRRRTIEQWKWMYRDAPAGPAKIVVIDDEGEIIAHEAMIPLHFHVLGEEVLGGKLEDAYIDGEVLSTLHDTISSFSDKRESEFINNVLTGKSMSSMMRE